MISQDQVKQVIEGKPEDRRLILEESAGILKYKTRKKEAVRKLGYTNENLQRIQDIIGELENQIEPLHDQAKEAKEYLGIKEKLSDMEIRLLAYDIKVDNEELCKLRRENEDLLVKMLSLSKQLDDDELSQTLLTDEHNDLTHQVQDLQFDLTHHAEMAQKKRGEADVIKERIAGADMSRAHLEGREQELGSFLAKLQRDVKVAGTQVQDASRTLNVKEQDERREYRLKHIVPIEADLRKKSVVYEELALELGILEKELAMLNDQHQHATYQKSSAKSQLDFLLDAKEDFIGFSEGTKQVLRAKKSGVLSGIEGAIAEVVTVPSEYEVAFDVILGPLASQVVTVTDEFAKKAIGYLKENRYGRATFLPMNVIKSRRLAADLLVKAQANFGFVAIASDALIFDPKYRQIVENLVGNVVIAKDLAAANQMAKSARHRFRIVTLEGDVINPGGSMTGGAMNRKNSSSVLRQNRQITKQEALVTRLEDAMLDLEAKRLKREQKTKLWQDKVINAKSAQEAASLKLAEANEHSLRSSYDLKVEIATLKANLQNGMSEVNRLNAECERVEDELKETREALENNDTTVVQYEQSLVLLTEEVKKIDEDKENITVKIREDRGMLVRLTDELKALELEIRASRRATNDVNMLLNKLSGDIGKLDSKLDIEIKKLESEYEMTFEYAYVNFPMQKDVASARAEVQMLNRQLSRFGTVNIGAIDEYERITDRYNFLESESEDLLLAADNLQASIDEMDGEMVAKFKETFDLVRLRYIETFVELFGGGHADLVLTNPDDLLNTGVEIIARPPGTKLGTSTLLSGGQKALTSIAMLFAILKVRIIPFCILDEVEAALDEANVARYAKYLKHFSDQTQFIVITHRRGTMEEADILYGVTMQERGITTMVACQMAELEVGS